MTTEREQILALAGAPVAEVVEYAIGGDGVFLRFTAEAAGRVSDGDKLYTIDQIIAAHRHGARDLVAAFARHVGGDGEFWLHELEDFLENHYGK